MIASGLDIASVASSQPSLPLSILALGPTPTWPLDHGNRKRIHEVLAYLKSQGHKITYLHYPSEGDWRDRAPPGAIAAMAAQWDGEVHHIAPTRGLHSDALGPHHELDEWWDPAIGHFLNWIFKAQKFDCFIVNYVWLSKAFEYAPRNIIKVLDTHDRFGSRKELLAANGVGPEFFYLKDEDELRGLRRADIVWAIKSEEAEYFSSHLGRQVRILTVPHADPTQSQTSVRYDPKLGLRIGLLGARNSVNAINTTAFLKLALPIFQRKLAPVKVICAGSMCDDLEGIKHPLLELMGRVAHVDEFYKAIDLVVTPISFSTGQKIKVAEALAYEKPLVSDKHAFEGFQPFSPYHQCRDSEEIVQACLALAFEPGRLSQLRVASINSARAAREAFELGLDETQRLVQDNSGDMLYVVPRAITAKGALYWRHIRDQVEFLHYACNLTCWYDGEVDLVVASRLAELGRKVKLAVSPQVSERLKQLSSLQWYDDVVSASDLFDWKRFSSLFISDLQDEVLDWLRRGSGALFLQADLIERTDGIAGLTRADINPKWQIAALSARRGPLPPAFASLKKTERYRVPFFYNGAPKLWSDKRKQTLDTVWLLLPELDSKPYRTVFDIVARVLGGSHRVKCIASFKDAVRPAAPASVEFVDVLDLENGAADLDDKPEFAIVYDGDVGRSALVQEVLKRNVIPTVNVDTRGLMVGPGDPMRPRTVGELISSIHNLATQGLPQSYWDNRWHMRPLWEYEGDSGWSWLWTTLRMRRQASSFGRTINYAAGKNHSERVAGG